MYIDWYLRGCESARKLLKLWLVVVEGGMATRIVCCAESQNTGSPPLLSDLYCVYVCWMEHEGPSICCENLADYNRSCALPDDNVARTQPEETLKPALSDHPTVQEKVVVVDRWSLKQGSVDSGQFFEALLSSSERCGTHTQVYATISHVDLVQALVSCGSSLANLRCRGCFQRECGLKQTIFFCSWSLKARGWLPRSWSSPKIFLTVCVSLSGHGPFETHESFLWRNCVIQDTKNKAKSCSFLDALGRRSCSRSADWLKVDIWENPSYDSSRSRQQVDTLRCA